MLKLDNVIIQYEKKAVGPFTANLESNKIYCIIGPSGAGKSTLIQAITNVSNFTGTISYQGRNINKHDYVYITQKGTLFNHLTVYDNLALTVDMTDASQVLNNLGLDESYLDKYPFNLSGGERQRIDLARAILSKVDLVFLDETFSSLDSKTKDDIYEIIIAMQKQYKMLILIVTHDLQEAVFLADSILLIDSGQIRFNDTPKSLVTSDNKYVANLVSNRKLQMLRSYYAQS